MTNQISKSNKIHLCTHEKIANLSSNKQTSNADLLPHVWKIFLVLVHSFLFIFDNNNGIPFPCAISNLDNNNLNKPEQVTVTTVQASII